jgi:FkbM family methyltransferase
MDDRTAFPQENEREILDELQQAQLLPGLGYYLDVGAGWPLEGSNTYFLYQRGWRGLLVEPLSDTWWSTLRYRPGDWLYPIAASNRTGNAVLRVCEHCSSLEPDWPIQETRSPLIEVAPLSFILNEFPTIRDGCHLCSIDVEGHEKQVLEGIDFQTFRPLVFIVEALKFSPALGYDAGGAPILPVREELWPQWEPILLEAGYRFYKKTTTGLNRFYLRSDL